MYFLKVVKTYNYVYFITLKKYNYICRDLLNQNRWFRHWMDMMEVSFTLFVMYILILTREFFLYPCRFAFLEGESGPSKLVPSQWDYPTTGQETSTLVKWVFNNHPCAETVKTLIKTASCMTQSSLVLAYVSWVI